MAEALLVNNLFTNRHYYLHPEHGIDRN